MIEEREKKSAYRSKEVDSADASSYAPTVWWSIEGYMSERPEHEHFVHEAYRRVLLPPLFITSQEFNFFSTIFFAFKGWSGFRTSPENWHFP